jgi:hypothetical protein
MYGLVLLVFSGVGLFLVRTAPVTGPTVPTVEVSSSVAVRETSQKVRDVELSGTLQFIRRGPDPKWQDDGYIGWGLVVDGKEYQLHFGAGMADAVKRLEGKRVRVHGRLEVSEHAVGRRSNGREPVPAIAKLMIQRVIQVAVLEVEGSTTVLLQGKVRMNTPLGYPAQMVVPVVEAGGKLYVLDLGSNRELQQAATKLNGKTVALQGTSAGFQWVTTMCVPGGTSYPVVRITAVKAGAA